jgi:hypothetical protein
LLLLLAAAGCHQAAARFLHVITTEKWHKAVNNHAEALM